MTILNEELSAAPGDKYEYYLDQYRIKHAEGYTDTYQVSPSYTSRDAIKEILQAEGVKVLLDYGCGKGVHYSKVKMDEYWGLEQVFKYDPAYEPYATKPEGKFECVMCYDVLEHIPEDSIDYVLQDIFSSVERVALFKMGLARAVAVLPNGENAHCTVKPLDWWRNKIREHRPEGVTVYVHHELL